MEVWDSSSGKGGEKCKTIYDGQIAQNLALPKGIAIMDEYLSHFKHPNITHTW